MSDNVHVTDEGILLFPQVFEPKRVKDGRGKETGDPIYSASLLLSPEAVKKTWAAAVEAAKEHFGAGVNIKTLRMPISNGEKKAAEAAAKNKDGSMYEGKFVLQARSQYAPGLYDKEAREDIEPGTTLAKRVRSGNWAHFEIKLRAYDPVGEDGKPGVKAYLNHILISREGKAIAGRTVADAFAEIMSKQSEQAVDVPDLDYEIPF